MRTLHALIVLTISLLYFSSVTAQSESEYETKSTEDFTFKDPFAFKNADSMYYTTDTLPYSNQVEVVLKSINKHIYLGKLLEKDEIWDKLISIEPYRMNPKTIREADKLAQKISSLVVQSDFKDKNISVNDLKEFSSLYKAGYFEACIKEGRKLLLKYPRNSDIRNNFALALMHNNKDLVALVELEIIRKLDSLHIPTLINLTMVYERLGMREDAENLAHYLLEIQKDSKLKIPQITYNVAWYYFSREDYFKVDSLLSLVGSDNIATYSNMQKLKELNKNEIRKYLKAKPFYKIGIAGKIGYYHHCDSAGWYIFFFIISSIVLFIIIPIVYRSLSENYDNYDGFPKFIALLVGLLGPAFYILSWGIPSGWYWLLPALYYIILPIIILLTYDD